jgi:hypothetical protein
VFVDPEDDRVFLNNVLANTFYAGKVGIDIGKQNPDFEYMCG